MSYSCQCKILNAKAKRNANAKWGRLLLLVGRAGAAGGRVALSLGASALNQGDGGGGVGGNEAGLDVGARVEGVRRVVLELTMHAHRRLLLGLGPGRSDRCR